MEEFPFAFGPDSSLVGILTRPASARSASTACLLFNAGLLHRVGPHRVNVKLARALAAQCIPTLRMDLSGLGDSLPAAHSDRYRDQVVADLRAGLSLLQRETGADHYLCAGICSGAIDAYSLALVDQRVGGLFMYDGYAFPTFRTHARLFWGHLRRTAVAGLPGAIRRFAARRVEERLRSAQGPGAPSKAAFKLNIETLVDRGVSIYIAHSGGLPRQHNYATQMNDAFGEADFLQRIEHAYLPHLDHTLTTLSAQQEFIGLVTQWARDVVAKRTQSTR